MPRNLPLLYCCSFVAPHFDSRLVRRIGTVRYSGSATHLRRAAESCLRLSFNQEGVTLARLIALQFNFFCNSLLFSVRAYFFVLVR